MMFAFTSPRILVVDALIGWNVVTVPVVDAGHYHAWFDDREFAQAYARGVSLGSGWTMHDESTPNVPSVWGPSS